MLKKVYCDEDEGFLEMYYGKDERSCSYSHALQKLAEWAAYEEEEIRIEREYKKLNNEE